MNINATHNLHSRLATRYEGFAMAGTLACQLGLLRNETLVKEFSRPLEYITTRCAFSHTPSSSEKDKLSGMSTEENDNNDDSVSGNNINHDNNSGEKPIIAPSAERRLSNLITAALTEALSLYLGPPLRSASVARCSLKMAAFLCDQNIMLKESFNQEGLSSEHGINLDSAADLEVNSINISVYYKDSFNCLLNLSLLFFRCGNIYSSRLVSKV
jgi:hypothetical protein